MKPTLVIMAAGMGSRYGGLKQLDPVGPHGETLLEYSVFDAIRAGFGQAVFVIRKDFEEAFKRQVGSRYEGRIGVRYAYQALENLPQGFTVPAGRAKPWGTGQAVLACKDLVAGPFAVQNADDFYGAEAYRAIAGEFGRLPPGEGCMVGYRLRRTLSPHGAVSRGVCTVRSGYLRGIVERTRIAAGTDGAIRCEQDGKSCAMAGDEVCSMNFWGFDPSLFQTLEEKFVAFLEAKGRDLRSEWYIPDIVDELIQQDRTRVKVLGTEGRWFGVTYPEDRPGVVAALAALHAAGHYPPSLRE